MNRVFVVVDGPAPPAARRGVVGRQAAGAAVVAGLALLAGVTAWRRTPDIAPAAAPGRIGGIGGRGDARLRGEASPAEACPPAAAAATCTPGAAPPSTCPIMSPCPTQTRAPRDALQPAAATAEVADEHGDAFALLRAAADVRENYALLGCAEMNTGCAGQLTLPDVRHNAAGFDVASPSRVWRIRDGDAHHNSEYLAWNVKLSGTVLQVRVRAACAARGQGPAAWRVGCARAPRCHPYVRCAPPSTHTHTHAPRLV